MKEKIVEFQQLVWAFYKKNKRSFLWRETQDPYKILVSEIMLQQTQADRVVAFYEKWLKRFPNFATLAKAPFSKIYPLWQGLGYNRRALYLKKAAEYIAKNGWPDNLQDLPGVGLYTARAISIFSYNRPLVCIETNIRRVFIHHFFPDAEVVTDEEILPLLELALPAKKSREWHWALMDYGAYLKSIVKNPNRRAKNYSIQSKFEGSLRQIRGGILRSLATGPKTSAKLKASKQVLGALEKEGFIVYKNKKYSLA
jgi:A/G-specific adenine glycosylase